MEKKLIEMITADQLLTWLVIAFLVGYFVYKEWPEFKRRITGAAVEKAASAATDKSLSARLTSIEEDIRQIKEKLDRDYGRLNEMERWRKSIDEIARDSLKEREILMQAMLGVLSGLQELGADGPTEDAKQIINRYINEQAHKVRKGGEHE